MPFAFFLFRMNAALPHDPYKIHTIQLKYIYNDTIVSIVSDWDTPMSHPLLYGWMHGATPDSIEVLTHVEFYRNLIYYIYMVRVCVCVFCCRRIIVLFLMGTLLA